MPDYMVSKPFMGRRPTRPNVSLAVSKDLGGNQMIMRSASDETVVTALIAALPSPPESPHIPQLYLSTAPTSRLPPLPVSSDEPFTGRPLLLRKQPSMPILQSQTLSNQTFKKFEYMPVLDDVGSPIVRSPSAAGSDGSSRASYSLFPTGPAAPPRSMRPRRSTAV